MNIKKEIENLLEKSLESLGVDFQGGFNLEHPQDLKNGDWTTNLALQLAGKEGINPREFAESILKKSEEKSKEIIIDYNDSKFNRNYDYLLESDKKLNFFIDWEKSEVAGPGYINFYLSKKYFFWYMYISGSNEAFSGTEKDGMKMGRPSRDIHSKEHIIIDKQPVVVLEHSSPNLFKPFHIGHMVNNSIGESLNRILKFHGNEVIQVAFPSDVSPGIAKTIWALKKEKKIVENLTLQEIADAYVLGTSEFKKRDDVKKEVEKINDEIYRFLNREEIKNQNIEFYQKGVELSLNHFKEITKKLGSEFSEIIFESKAERVGKGIVKNNLGSVFKEVQNEDGTKTIIFEGEQYTNVFINSHGYGTYLTKDTGLLKIKKDEFSEVEKSLVITDVEQKQHFEMVKEAGEKIPEIFDFVKKSEYLQHGRMKFAGNVKISSRYGNVPLALDVIERVQENILEKMAERDFYEEEKKEISEKLAIATLKYSILKVTSGKNISFDLEKDTDPQGNTGTFLMYSLVRAKSIYAEKDNFNFSPSGDKISNPFGCNFIGDTPDIVKKLERFVESVEKSMRDNSPHSISNYLYDLSSEFNRFYSKTKILDKNNSNFIYNFGILRVFISVMETGFNLLGIETVDKM